MNEIISQYKCDHCGETVSGGVFNLVKHDNECLEKLISLWNGVEVKTIKRKEYYAESSKSGS